MPAPARRSATLVFDLASSAEVTCDVFDVTGRRVARPIQGMVLPAGRHEVIVPTRTLPPGTYFVRVAAGDASATRRLVRIQ